MTSKQNQTPTRYRGLTHPTPDSKLLFSQGAVFYLGCSNSWCIFEAVTQKVLVSTAGLAAGGCPSLLQADGAQCSSKAQGSSRSRSSACWSGCYKLGKVCGPHLPPVIPGPVPCTEPMKGNHRYLHQEEQSCRSPVL